MTNPAIWDCKIGEVDRDKLPHGSDLPMRDAVRACYRELTGKEPDFIFSGWAATLDETERAVIEDRLPDPEVIRDELVARLETLPVAWQDDEPTRPDTPDPDLLEMAWGIIANANGGDWGAASDEWREAATRWRDRYHAFHNALNTLAASQPKPQTKENLNHARTS